MTAPRFAVTGDLAALPGAALDVLFRRDPLEDPARAARVAEIIARVRAEGDAALCALAARFDGAALTPATLEVPRAALAAALAGLAAPLRADLARAAAAIEAFHRAQRPETLRVTTAPGVHLEWRAEPLGRVGVYAPGGRALYPSSVLMGVIPARVAGVGEICVASPPGPNGRPADLVLAAAALAGADRVFALGGAGAVAAFAFGTPRVPAVDRLVGPGNAWVAEAKRQVAGVVPVDSPAGPSEVIVVADDSADPRAVALELLAQAEHDAEASAVLVALDARTAARARDALAELLAAQPRRATIAAALAARGALLTAADRAAAARFVERYAPEHLALMVRAPRELAERITTAGTICLGASASVVFGDYLTGANHVLPTGGAARRFSGLSVQDCVRRVTWQELEPAGARALAGPTARLARAEGLPAHAAAAELRGADGEGVESAAADAPGAAGAASGAVETGGAVAPAPAEARGAAPPPAPRRGYADIALYAPDRRAATVDLSDNTNLFGAAPAALATLRELAEGGVNRYPGVFAEELKEALALYHDVSVEALATGCGSDDLLDSIVRAFCEPGDRLALPAPTFAMVPTFARMNGVRPIACAPAPDGGPDLDALLATGARLIYLCRPNNPTGTSVARAAVERLLAEAPGLVLLDEAYAEFAGDDFLRQAPGAERLIVVRTFSKAWGLAGLRVGYAAGPPGLMAAVEKSRGPYKVNAPAERAAAAALRADGAWLADVVRRTRAERAWLAEQLAARGWPPLASEANFLALPLPARLPAVELAARLRALGVAVRPCPEVPGVGGAVRVTVGPRPLMETFLAALERASREAEAAPARPAEVSECA